VFSGSDSDSFTKLTTSSKSINNNQRPFLAPHPLSSTISFQKSHFEGRGLATTNMYDDFWLYTQSTLDSNVDPVFNLYNIILTKTIIGPLPDLKIGM
jgi:hypothetical protein